MFAGGLETIGVQHGPVVSTVSRTFVDDDDLQTRQRHRRAGADRLFLTLLAGRRRAVLAVGVTRAIRHVGDAARRRRFVAGRQDVLADDEHSGDDQDAGSRHGDRHQHAAARSHRSEPAADAAVSAAASSVVCQDDGAGTRHDRQSPSRRRHKLPRRGAERIRRRKRVRCIGRLKNARTQQRLRCSHSSDVQQRCRNSTVTFSVAPVVRLRRRWRVTARDTHELRRRGEVNATESTDAGTEVARSCQSAARSAQPSPSFS